jgi:hypothetical protein
VALHPRILAPSVSAPATDHPPRPKAIRPDTGNDVNRPFAGICVEGPPGGR